VQRRALARQYVFGYGSLLERFSADGPRVCEVGGYRRTWNVAMDNSRTIPGYKHYVDAATGEREPWFVTFLNIVPDPDARVNGLLFAVDDALLHQLDRRERNYTRTELPVEVPDADGGRVWAYVGSDDGVRRFHLGRNAGRAVVSREYLDGVRDDFASADALERFDALTDLPPCPILTLRRIDHPVARGRAERAGSL
jgi:gamma-glutamylcyclotransferase (GGCT)/AIG2-like uncharacterized protein YtfP